MWLTGVLLLWCLDGLVQEWQGVSLSGYPLFTGLPEGHKVTGSMGLDYGPHLAVLSPLLFEAVRMHGRRLPMLWLAVPVLVAAVSLSASRYSLFLLLVSAAVFLPLWARALGWRGTLILLAGVIVGLVIPVVALPHLAERLSLALGSLSLNPEDYNTGFAFRPELWRASWIVFLENWLNGVGVRGSGLAMEPILVASLYFRSRFRVNMAPAFRGARDCRRHGHDWSGGLCDFSAADVPRIFKCMLLVLSWRRFYSSLFWRCFRFPAPCPCIRFPPVGSHGPPWRCFGWSFQGPLRALVIGGLSVVFTSDLVKAPESIHSGVWQRLPAIKMRAGVMDATTL